MDYSLKDQFLQRRSNLEEEEYITTSKVVYTIFSNIGLLHLMYNLSID